MRAHYYLFRYAPGHWRMAQGATVQQACQEAFGMIYDGNSDVVYKDLGTRSPAYVSAKAKQVWYGEDGWSRMPGGRAPVEKEVESEFNEQTVDQQPRPGYNADGSKGTLAIDAINRGERFVGGSVMTAPQVGGRFAVEPHGDVWFVRDQQWEQLKQTSERAAVLYFRTKGRAQMVCDLLNQEWAAFLRNPQ